MTNTQQIKGTIIFNTVKAKTITALVAVVAAVALPQILHVAGAATGLGAAFAQTLLPMHLPVLLVGLLAGPLAGLLVGMVSPVISFALSGMPSAAMLSFMVIELAAYGFLMGMLSNVKMPVIAKVLVVQVIGRGIKALAILISFYALGNQAAPVASIISSIGAGLPGLVLQWLTIPMLIIWLNNRGKNNG